MHAAMKLRKLSELRHNTSELVDLQALPEEEVSPVREERETQ